jgi:hypothetical protein
MERKDVIRSVVQAAEEFNQRRLWTRFANIHCFGVRFSDPNAPQRGGSGEPMLGVVLGAGREEFGLSLFRGPQAAAALTSLFRTGGMGDDALQDLDLLGFSMDKFGNLPPEAQALLREAGLHPRYDEQTPSFLVKPPGQRPRVTEESELILLLRVLRAVVKADRKKQLQPATLDSKEGICVLTIGGDPAQPQVSVTREKWQSPQAPRTIPLPSGGPDLRGLPILDETWLVGTPALAGGIQGDNRDTQLLLVAEEASEYLFEARPVFAGDVRDAMEAIVRIFRKGPQGRKGMPHRIVFSNRKLHEAMAALLEPLGVECTFQSVIPKLRQIADEFLNLMGSEAPPFAEEGEAETEGDTEVPAPDDLKGWKQVDQRLPQRFIDQVRSGGRFRSSRAVKRYFDDDDLEYYLQEHEKQAVAAAYTAWCILDYRPTKTSKTRAEEMLAAGLPEPEAILLRARMEAYPTLYRIAGHDPKAGTVDLEDVLLGGKVTVHDQLLSENIEDNVFFCARTFRAGQFHFLEPAGPPLGEAMGMEAAEFLQHSGMEFTPEGLRRDAHMFGWLWRWMDDWQANWRPPLLRNTDGDELLWHTASFAVADPAQTRQALLGRPDIEYDDQDDEFVWIKKTGEGAKMLGGPVTMGRIEFVGDELVLTVNSAKRFATARKWLEKLPGVAFRSVKTRAWDEQEKDLPMDERMPGPEPVEMTPELTSALQDMLNKQYMAWMDMPLPVLRGETPRQACRTEAGRRQVGMLIRTMPDPSGPAPIRVPRDAMLRELGLLTETAAPPSARAPQPPEPVRPEPSRTRTPESDDKQAESTSRGPQVPRNAPCPCGSGHKYKKCCGRTPQPRP